MSDTAKIGKYSVVKRLGAGGMAEVFLCRLTGLGGFEKLVVVKRVLPAHAHEPRFLKLFLDEARLSANLNHPNIVQIFEIEQDEHGMPFIAMEYVAGTSFHCILKAAWAKRMVEPACVAKVVAGACAGLHHAHEARDANGRRLEIVHRDVSPDNIMVSLEGVPKVVDFGVAKAKGRLTQTRAGVLRGKPAFFAPEQLRGERFDRRVDVWATGVCLYHGLTGKFPFGASAQPGGEWCLRPPRAVNPKIPEPLEEIILWALQVNPEKRCPTCLALHEALEGLVREGPLVSSAAHVVGWMNGLMCAGNPAPTPKSEEATRVSGKRAAPPEPEVPWWAWRAVWVAAAFLVLGTGALCLLARLDTRHSPAIVAPDKQSAIQHPKPPVAESKPPVAEPKPPVAEPERPAVDPEPLEGPRPEPERIPQPAGVHLASAVQPPHRKAPTSHPATHATPDPKPAAPTEVAPVHPSAPAAQPAKPDEPANPSPKAADPPAAPRPAPTLQARYSARNVREIIKVMGEVESALVSSGGMPAALAHGACEPLTHDLLDTFTPGLPVEIFPLGAYEFALRHAGDPSVGEQLQHAHASGQLRLGR